MEIPELLQKQSVQQDSQLPKNHNYFYTNSNQVIQEPKSHPKKSSFWEKYHKNANPNISNPETQKQ